MSETDRKMSDKKADLAAVSTFADHEVILPPNKLKKAVQKVSPTPRSSSIRWRRPKPRSPNCRRTSPPGWARNATASTPRSNADARRRHQPGHARRRCSSPRTTSRARPRHSAFPLVAPVADSLCRLIEHTPDMARLPLRPDRPARRCGPRDHHEQYARRQRGECRQARRKAAAGDRRIPQPREPRPARITWNRFCRRRSRRADQAAASLPLPLPLPFRQASRRTAAPLRAAWHDRHALAWTLPGLLRKPHTIHEIGKSWIGAQSAPARIKTQPNQPMRPLVESLIEACERRVILAKAGVDERDAVGRHELTARQPLQFSEYFLRLIAAASGRGDEASRRDRNRPFVQHFLDLPEFCECFVVSAKLLKRTPQPRCAGGKFRFIPSTNSNCLTASSYRPV